MAIFWHLYPLLSLRLVTKRVPFRSVSKEGQYLGPCCILYLTNWGQVDNICLLDKLRLIAPGTFETSIVQQTPEFDKNIKHKTFKYIFCMFLLFSSCHICIFSQNNLPMAGVGVPGPVYTFNSL